MTLLADQGEITQVVGHNESAMIASEQGLWVVGENKNNQMGACDKAENDVCKLQLNKNVSHDTGNQILSVEGVASMVWF